MDYYHIQRLNRIDNIENLTIDLLKNHRPLFLCTDDQTWFLNNTDDEIFRKIKLQLHDNLIKSITLPKDKYFSLFHYNPTFQQYLFTVNMWEYSIQGYNLFIKQHDMNSEDEMFLLFSKKLVKNMQYI